MKAKIPRSENLEVPDASDRIQPPQDLPVGTPPREPKKWRAWAVAGLIAFSAISLATNVFELTHHLLAALEWGGAFSVGRTLVEFRPFFVRTGRKLATMGGLTLAMVALDALIATTSAGHPRDWPGLLALLVSSVGFFCPELAIWNLGNAPAISRTYQIKRHGHKYIALPDVKNGDCYELRLSGWWMEHLGLYYIGLKVHNLDRTLGQDLGIIRRSTYIATSPLAAGSYVLQIDNYSPAQLEVTVEVHIRTFHL